MRTIAGCQLSHLHFPQFSVNPQVSSGCVTLQRLLLFATLLYAWFSALWINIHCVIVLGNLGASVLVMFFHALLQDFLLNSLLVTCWTFLQIYN